jgi:hypothetical protein
VLTFSADVLLSYLWRASLQSLNAPHILFRVFLQERNARNLQARCYSRSLRPSLDLEDNLSAHVSTGCTLMRFMRIRQVELAVDPDT